MEDALHKPGYVVELHGQVAGSPGSPPRPLDPWALAGILPCQVCGGRLLGTPARSDPGSRLCERCGRPWIVWPSVNHFLGVIVAAVSVPVTPAGGAAWDWQTKWPCTRQDYEDYSDSVRDLGGVPTKFEIWVLIRKGV